MAFSEDGRLLTLASGMGRVYIWDPNFSALNLSIDDSENRSSTDACRAIRLLFHLQA